MNVDQTDPQRKKLAGVLRQVRLLEIRSRHLVTEVLAGHYSSAFHGRGVEFADVREYVPGDDVRTIDWRVTARMDATYVRRYVEERELTVLLLLDFSASAAFGSRVRTKAELATEVCAVLAMTAVRSNDRVGAVLFTDRVEKFISPKRGKRHALRVIRELLACEPQGTGTDLAAALQFANRVLHRRAVIFVASDWLTGDYQRPLEDLARRHDAVAIQVIDGREREVPEVGLLTLRDPETGRSRTIDSSDPAVREAFRHRTTAFDAALERMLRRCGIGVMRLQTDQSYIFSLLSFFKSREKVRRR